MGINGRISQTERVSYSLLHCLYMQMSCSCQKVKKETGGRERHGEGGSQDGIGAILLISWGFGEGETMDV